jgi:tRNA-specific 2-thiouridylase
MSGGVDSSLAAARLIEQGFDVVGVTLRLCDGALGSSPGEPAELESLERARLVARQLGIPHYALDRRSLFAKRVVEPFVDGYLSGITPSPCVVCNQQVKLPSVMRLARRLSARWVATGHYARAVQDEGGRQRLARGRDPSKDQSYFLFALPATVVQRLCLPLGEATKQRVRAEAQARGLPAPVTSESQDLCFLGGNSYASFVEQQAPGRSRPGDIVDRDGRRLGSHGGVHRFTLGQRKGVGVAAGRRLFVSRIDATRAQVVLDEAEALWTSEVVVRRFARSPGVRLPCRASVQVRYRQQPVAATLLRDGTGVRIVFDTPVRAPSAGQAAVAYLDDLVVGGGIISRVPGG